MISEDEATFPQYLDPDPGGIQSLYATGEIVVINRFELVLNLGWRLYGDRCHAR